MEPIAKFSGTARYWDENGVIFSRGSQLFHTDRMAAKILSVSRLPVTGGDRALSVQRYLRRLTRKDAHHVRPLAGAGLFALGYGRAFVQSATGWQRPAGVHGRRPLAVASAPDGSLYYGEYRDNAERSPVSVWTSPDGGLTWRAAWTFTTVRHVHGVFHDPHDGAFWVTTGDRDEESGLWRTHDRFRTLEQVKGGTQAFRVVQPLFTPQAVLFGSDAPEEVNWLQRLDRQTGLVTQVQRVAGPVFYGTQSGSWVFFSTVVEPSRINCSTEAEVWASRDDGRGWTRVLSFEKDLLPPRLFQYGQVLFPAGPGCPGLLWLTPFATEGDQTSLCYRLAA